MLRVKRRFAIFDLDRTITTGGTFTPFLLSTQKTLLARAALLSKLLPHMIAYKCGIIKRKTLKDKMLSAALDGVSRAKLSELSNTFVAIAVSSNLRPKAVEAIARHKSNGDCLVLATASVDFYASVFASQLGFEICVSTGTTYLEPSTTPIQTVGPNCYGAAKVEMVTAALAGQTGQPKNQQHWTFYSDHYSDVAMFELADEPYVISPAAKTRREAAKRNFPILDW